MMQEYEYYKGKRILVTGASGYLGTALCEKLSQLPCILYRLYHSTLPLSLHNAAEVNDVNSDISNSSSWNDLLSSVDIIFHFAAQTSANTAAKNPEKDYQVNVLPVVDLINACEKNHYRPIVIMASTVTICGLTNSAYVNEDFADNPLTVYDSHKLEAERHLIESSIKGDLNGIVLRLPNIYGPGNIKGATDRGILNKSIQLAMQGKPLTVWGTGEYIRDYLYIDDAIGAFLKAGIYSDRVKSRYFILGTGKGTTIQEAMELVSQVVMRKTGVYAEITNQKEPEGISPIEKRNFIANYEKFKNETGWEPEISLEKGISNFIDVLMKQNKNEKKSEK